MAVDTRDFEREPGQWWIQVLYPVIEGCGVSEERWGEPVVALLEEARWWLPRKQTPVCFEVRVLARAEYRDGTKGAVRMRPPREPGFYWVRYPDAEAEPVVARWDEQTAWLVPGYEREWIESALVVSDRLEPPA